MTKGSSPWNDQPDDVLRTVVGRLGQRDVRSVALVCRDWAIQVDRVLPSIRTTPASLQRTMDRFQSLESVEVVFRSVAPTYAQLEMLGAARSLSTLKLHNCCPVSSKPLLTGLGALAPATASSQASRTTCGGTNYTGRLRSLELCCFRLRSDCGLVELATGPGSDSSSGSNSSTASASNSITGVSSGCSGVSLKRLALRGCELEGVDFLARAVAAHAATLAELDAEGASVPSPAAYAGLARLPNLRCLVLRHASRLGGGVLAHVSSLTSLTRLDVSRAGPDAYQAEGVSDDGLRLLQGLVGLRALSLAGHGEVTDEGVALLGVLPQLEDLDIRQPLELLHAPPPHAGAAGGGGGELAAAAAAAAAGGGNGGFFFGAAAAGAAPAAPAAGGAAGGSGSLTGAGVASLLLRTRSATSLSLSGASVCAASCEAMARLTTLTRLAMADCSSLRDGDLYTLSPLSSRLAALSLSGCGAGLTDIGVVQLARAFPRLASLQLCYASGRVTRFGLCALGGLRSLEHLDVSGCEAVDDELLRRLLPSLPHMSSLQLADCRRLTDAACACVASHLQLLQSLSLERCCHVTDKGLRQLETMRRLQHLNVHGTRASAGVRDWPGFRLVSITIDKPFWWMA